MKHKVKRRAGTYELRRCEDGLNRGSPTFYRLSLKGMRKQSQELADKHNEMLILRYGEHGLKYYDLVGMFRPSDNP